MERMHKHANKSDARRRVAQARFTSGSRQNAFAKDIDESPAMVAQRNRLDRLFGPAIQRIEDEEPLQGKFAVAQAKHELGEEEFLPSRFGTTQRFEDKESLQGKFEAPPPVQRENEGAKPNNTGLPDNMKSSVESTPLQLTVKIRGSSDNIYGKLMTARKSAPLNKEETEVFNNWNNSSVKHDFVGSEYVENAKGKYIDKKGTKYTIGMKGTRYNRLNTDKASLLKLQEAIERAIEARSREGEVTKDIDDKDLPDPPAIYRAANLKFLTLDKRKDRLPTLYFIQGTKSSRLRQQHGSGPLAQETVTGKVDYFGKKKNLLDIKEYAKTQKKTSLNKRDKPSVQEAVHNKYGGYEGYLVAKIDDSHLEITYDGPNFSSTHISGGTFKSADGYDNKKIKKIYSQIVGRIS